MAIARSSPYKRDPTPSFFPFHPRYPASLVPPHLRISLLLHLPFFFAYPFVSLSSFQAIYSSLPRFFSCLSPFSLSPLFLPPRRVNSRRIKFEEGGGSWRVYGVRLPISTPAQQRLLSIHPRWNVSSPIHPYSTPYACARFFQVFWGRTWAQPTTTTTITTTVIHTGFSTYTL